MTREQLLQPGQYLGLPKALAADPTISATAKLVWAVVADRLGSNETAWPGYPCIAADAGTSARTAKRMVRELEQSGWVAVKRRSGESNIYTLSMPNPCQVGTGANPYPVQVGTTTGAKLALPPGQAGTSTRANLSPELPNRTTEVTTEGTTAALRCAGEGAVAPGASAEQPPLEAEGKSRTKAKPKADRKKLTPLDLQRICSSFDSMERYLLYGLPGLSQDGELPPSQLNWRRFQNPSAEKLEDRYGLAQWDGPTFMGFFWWRVSQWRTERGMPLSLPQWGRLAGDIKNLMKTTTPDRFYIYVNVVVQFFDLIRFMKGNAGCTLSLDFDSLNHGMIRSAALEIMKMTQTEVDAWIEKMTRALAA